MIHNNKPNTNNDNYSREIFDASIDSLEAVFDQFWAFVRPGKNPKLNEQQYQEV